MPAPTLPKPPRTPGRAVPADDAVRVRFTDPTAADPTAAGRPFRRYADPAPAVAVVEPAANAEDPVGPDLFVLRRSDPDPSSPAVDAWLAGAAAVATVDVPLPGGRLLWRPDRAVFAGPVADRDDVLAGVADFGFYEAALRRLEAEATPHEQAAAADVRLAYRIADADRDQWDRLGQAMERLAALRLTFARLEPRLTIPPRDLPVAGRRAFRRLVARAEVEARLEAVSNRLEACEDLYEGAVDRITDHRWWRRGHRLETIIVVLLAVEGAQLAVELVLHLLQLRGR